jgi:hypothetical protein
MKERLFKNYITTIIGILLLLSAGYVAVFQKDTERATFIGGYALIFLRSKDSLIALPKN